MLAIFDLDDQAIEMRTVDAPEPGLPDIERERNLRVIVRERQHLRTGGGNASIGIQRGDPHGDGRLRRQGTAQKNAVVNHCGAGRLFGSNVLAANPYRSRGCEPDITHQATVGPPVVARIRAASRRDARDRCHSRAVVESDHKDVRATQTTGDIERVGCEASFVRSQLLAVQPDPRAVEGGSEVQLDMTGPGCEFEPPKVPGNTAIVVQAANIPRMRHRDGLRSSRDRLRPSGSQTALLGVRAELPVGIQVRATCGARLRRGRPTHRR